MHTLEASDLLLSDSYKCAENCCVQCTSSLKKLRFFSLSEVHWSDKAPWIFVLQVLLDYEKWREVLLHFVIQFGQVIFHILYITIMNFYFL